MEIAIRMPRADEAEAVFRVCAEAFTTSEKRRERWLATRDMSCFLGGWAADSLVATTEVIPLGQFFGGRSVPMGGVAAVAVRPAHRGRGVGPRLLAAAVTQMREHGQAISTLHPATTRFYRRLGWEIGGQFGVWRVPTASLAALPPGEPECVRPATPDDATPIRDCYEQVASSINGCLKRTPAFWPRTDVAVERPHRYRYVFDVDGRVEGYVVYDQYPMPAQWGFALTVREIVAADPSAAVTLWRLIGSHSPQVEHITVLASPLDLLTLLLPEQVVELAGANHWMTRIVDASGAIAARGYPSGVRASVHIELVDRLAPWNTGRFVLDVADGAGTLRPGGTGDVHLGVNALASLYTGWASARLLAAAGLVHHARDRDLAALDAVFAGPRPYLFDDY
jgi:predicted acetyltransferase